MALLWSFDDGNNHYEVRSAGASIRLYRNGVNHSQWNPNRPLAGSVWDLLTLPALHRDKGSLQRALMLGFGAGASGRQLRDLAKVEHLVGVELDPVHLSIADGFFECADGCELVAGDAVEWVESEPAETYDYIVDDLYAEEENVPVRCVALDVTWFKQVTSLLRPGGIFVLNMIEPEKVAMLPILKDRELNTLFPYRIGYQLDGYENRVIAISDRPFLADKLRINLKDILRRFPRCSGVDLKYETIDLP